MPLVNSAGAGHGPGGVLDLEVVQGETALESGAQRIVFMTAVRRPSDRVARAWPLP